MLSQIVMARKEGVFDGVELFRWDFGALFAIPIIVFGFNCHANVRANCLSQSKNRYGLHGCQFTSVCDEERRDSPCNAVMCRLRVNLRKTERIGPLMGCAGGDDLLRARSDAEGPHRGTAGGAVGISAGGAPTLTSSLFTLC